MLAAIALAALILLIVVMVFAGNQSSEDDRLTGNEVVASNEDPADRCSSRVTYDQIKRELFRRAAALRGTDEAAFGKIASSSAVRMEAAVLRDESADGGATCNGTLTLDLPPGVAAAGGRRSLSADVLYTVHPGANGGASPVTLSNADEIIVELSTLSRTSAPTDDALSNTISNGVVADPLGPDTPEADPLAPLQGVGSPATGVASPSFNCANARTPGEIAVCNEPGLAALDRRMAAQYASALSQADPDQRALLQRTREAFLGYRDQCTSNACVADTYRGRMREIRDIMMGNWTPQR
jgi:uncharacterized protein YecT (DUF1311 family)